MENIQTAKTTATQDFFLFFFLSTTCQPFLTSDKDFPLTERDRVWSRGSFVRHRFEPRSETTPLSAALPGRPGAASPGHVTFSSDDSLPEPPYNHWGKFFCFVFFSPHRFRKSADAETLRRCFCGGDADGAYRSFPTPRSSEAEGYSNRSAARDRVCASRPVGLFPSNF